LSNEMSYGWARTEILGGLTNGCFLLSLCLYVSLEAIPKLIRPETSKELQEADGGYLFIAIAGAGLIVNIVGTIIFAAVGVAHGHSHSHGHGHGHGHGHAPALAEGFGALAQEEHKHEEHEHEHGHDHKHAGHEHDHEHGHDHKHDDHDGHEHKKSIKKTNSTGDIPIKAKNKKGKDHKHKHGEEHKHKHEDHEGHSSRRKLSEMDVNTWAVFIHFLGDAISSLFVLATGLLLHFFQAGWTKYIDPVSSLFIVLLIVTTTIPLVKRCSMILLQSVPSEIDLEAVRLRTSTVRGVVSVHDLHVWQLVDGMIIASVHLMIEEGTDVGNVVYQVKQIFHTYGIHSSAIQPEYIKSTVQKDPYCLQNCVEECEEDWCCKKGAEKTKDLQEQYSTFNEV